MDDAHLMKYAANEARELRPEGTVPVRRLGREIRRGLSTVESACRALSQWSEGETALPPAVEWLLDNRYLAVRAGQEALLAFGRGKALRGTEGGEALLMECARKGLWAVPDLDSGRLSRYLEAFQSVRPLTERELSLLMPALAGALVCRLARLCDGLEEWKAGKRDPGELETMFSALRGLTASNWGPVLEGASRVERVLRQDPSGDYPHMDEDTRRRYRQQVCRLARRYRMEESQAAGKALDLSRKGEGSRRHIGWYLYRQPLGADRPGRKSSKCNT